MISESGLPDKEYALKLIQEMHRTVTLGTIIRRLQASEVARNMAIYLVTEKKMDPIEAAKICSDFIRSKITTPHFYD